MTSMRRNVTYICIIVLVSLVFIAGCSNYAKPDLVLTTDAQKVSADPGRSTITYQITVHIANQGDSNAYNTKLLIITGTPKDQPEYTFASKNVDIGTIGKGKNVSVTEKMNLNMSEKNYQQLSSGTKPFVDAQITKVTSNMMDT